MMAPEAMDTELADLARPIVASLAAPDIKDTRFQGGAPFGWHGQSWFEEGSAQDPVQPLD